MNVDVPDSAMKCKLSETKYISFIGAVHYTDKLIWNTLYYSFKFLQSNCELNSASKSFNLLYCYYVSLGAIAIHNLKITMDHGG